MKMQRAGTRIVVAEAGGEHAVFSGVVKAVPAQACSLQAANSPRDSDVAQDA